MRLSSVTVVYATIFASIFIFSEGKRSYGMVCNFYMRFLRAVCLRSTWSYDRCGVGCLL